MRRSREDGEDRIMTDDWRKIDGLVDLVLTRALAMSERQFGMGLSIVTVTDIVTHSVNQENLILLF